MANKQSFRIYNISQDIEMFYFNIHTIIEAWPLEKDIDYFLNTLSTGVIKLGA